jgi:predicted MFS family arabinose efflux permease
VSNLIIDDVERSEVSRQNVLYVLGLLTFVNIFSFVDRIALSILLPSIQAQLNLSDSQAGVLIGLAYSLIFAVSGIPLARLADRSVRRDIIAASIAFWSIATAACGAAQNLVHLFLARVSVAIGESGVQPASSSLICDYVPQSRRGGAFAAVTMGNSLGVAAGWLSAGLLNDLIGWRWTFVVLGLPGLCLALLVRTTLREPRRGLMDAAPRSGNSGTFGSVLRQLAAIPAYRWLVIYSVAALFTQNGVQQWLPSYLVRSFNLSTSDIGLNLSAVSLCSGILGTVIGGALANKYSTADVRVPLWLSALAIACSVPAICGVIFASEPRVAFALLAVVGVCWSIPAGSTLASMQNVVPAEMRATATAIMILTVGALGLSLGPLVVGTASDLLRDQFGSGSLRYALLIPVCASVITFCALLQAARHLRRDLEHAQAC